MFIIPALLLALGLAGAFVLGYILARIDALCDLVQKDKTPDSAPANFFSKKPARQQEEEVSNRVARVAIDERKFVSDIKTDNIQKVTDIELGKKTQQQDNINQSVSRLAQLKGREG
jgi:hypothetical protein